MIFDELVLWFDPEARSGLEAMAVDEWLLETAEMPLLRVYGWRGEWGSLGYFGELERAKQAFPGLSWVRRCTGGGVVDHRDDWTYSLIVPSRFEPARWKSGESYRAIHEELAKVLAEESAQAPQLAGANPKSGGVCFEHPVEFDVLGIAGEKIAGAAQRRCKEGLLHQGSVAGKGDFRSRGERLASGLASVWSEREIFPDAMRVNQLVSERYGCEAWLGRR